MEEHSMAAINTDKELFREVEGDSYSSSCHITQKRALGINVGGIVYVKPLHMWHKLADNDHCLLVENQRLREALEKILSIEKKADGVVGFVDNPYQRAIRAICMVCREALKLTGDNKEAASGK